MRPLHKALFTITLLDAAIIACVIGRCKLTALTVVLLVASWVTTRIENSRV